MRILGLGCQSLSVWTRDSFHADGHGSLGNTAALIQHGEEGAEAGKKTIFIHPAPEVGRLQGALEAAIADGVFRTGGRRRLRKDGGRCEQ